MKFLLTSDCDTILPSFPFKTASKIFDINKQELLNDLNSEKSVVTIAKKQEKEKIEQLKKYLEEKNIVQGINIDKDTKRFYPYACPFF